MPLYPAALPLSSQTLNLTARVIRAHRENTGTRWRRLDPAQQALLLLVHPYKAFVVPRVGAKPRSIQRTTHGRERGE